jgi:hypothetical protein
MQMTSSRSVARSFAFWGSPKLLAQEKCDEVNGAGTTGDLAVFLLADIKEVNRWWGYSRLALQRWPLAGTQGLVLAKIMGSGFGGGFGLKPSASRQAIFCIFRSEEDADRFLDSALTQEYRKRSGEFLIAKLRAFSSRGSWSGRSLAVTTSAPARGPVASLTRASIRPTKAFRFWQMQPASESSLVMAQGCTLATGVGEAPILRQATFSLWSEQSAMDAYARSGAHLAAIQAAYKESFFSESMFVRFSPILLKGSWRGQHYA